jgi:hypothetical protein
LRETTTHTNLSEIEMKWKLNTQHYINDALLEEGTIVGDDCAHNFLKPDGTMHMPSLNMEPADQEAVDYLKKHPRKFGDNGLPVPTELLQIPNSPMPGQRIGGLGPKPNDTGPVIPGQGPQSGSAAAIDHALVEKTLNAPANTNPFANK